ncbi:hypothetical protein HCBG_06234 [Histoplasma capsulatum G186AR]|uniref:Uncharacterized protein n=1 Tax=Ajellomyces capsulatus (strain G186AR / H82 / ATCC MYA-2454 / RMSCC 2432) TaxID=447093 RepID=C0NSV4_AJECG|nr:uncharacterized protein HCBG_06234 [Histoplasma capsulatum G186AR]EEH05115.1 hypothetical protein HCBG_06234 [Histoplasma capsulatum G186AR]
MSAVLIATQSYLNTCQQTSQCEVYPLLAILRGNALYSIQWGSSLILELVAADLSDKCLMALTYDN